MVDFDELTPFVRNAINLNRFSNRLSREILEIYVRAAREVLREFNNGEGSTERKVRRLRALADQFERTISSAFEDEYPELLEQLRVIADKQATFDTRQLRRGLRETDVSVTNVSVTKEYIEALAQGKPSVRMNVTGESIEGEEFIRRSLPRIMPEELGTLEEAFQDLANSQSTFLTKTLKSELLQGKTNDQILRALIKGNKIPKGSPLKKTERAIKAVIRSAVIGTAADTQIAVIDANKDITEEYEYVATLDSRTTLICASLDGQIFRYDDPTAPKPPLHPNCRSVIKPSLEKFYKKNNIDPPSATRASKGDEAGQVDGDLSYEQWLRQQSPEFQDEVLGEGKAELFRQGMSLSEFVRQDGSEISLDELG